jgi:hypothetical protein
MQSKILNKEVIKWWESKRWMYNILTIISGIICLIIMKFINNAAVNFFMLPFWIIDLVIFNILYTIFYTKKTHDNNVKRRKTVLRAVIGFTILLNVILGTYCVIAIPHR